MNRPMRLVRGQYEDPIGREKTARGLQEATREVMRAVNIFQQAVTETDQHSAEQLVLEALANQRSAWDAFRSVVQAEWR